MNTDLKKLIIVGTGTNAKHVFKLVKFYDLFDVIGFAVDGDKARLYFELRENGQSVDPTGRFK